MERLTYRSPHGNAVSKGACSGIKCDFVCDACSIDTLIQHLCYYEDMIESGKLVEHGHGHWIIGLDGSYMCSECGRVFRYEIGDYCTACGAKLEYEE